MSRRSRSYSFNNKTKKIFIGGTVVAETNESNVATVSGVLDANTQANITTVGTLTNVTSSGNVSTDGFFLGNGSQLTGLSSTVKNYVDSEISNLAGSAPGTLDTLNEIAAALGNDPNLATTLTNTITSANTAMKGYVDGEITSVGLDITTANTAMKGYVDGTVSTANTAVVGYVDNAVSTANTAMKGYVDGEIASVPPGYADSDVADYLPTYSGNVGANYVNANFFTGNGSQLTGLPAGYSDADVDAHLSGGTGVTYSSGTISIGQAVGTGNSPTFADGSFTGNLGIGTGSPNYKLDVSAGTLGTTSGDAVNALELTTTTSNGDYLRFRKIREANGSDWQTAAWRIQQTVDVTNQAYIQFNGSTNTYGLSFGTNTTERVRLTSAGRVGIGNTAPLHTLSVTGDAFVSGSIFGTASSAKYADLAEKYISDKDYAPGTVVAFGGGYEITESTQSHQRSVAGVISTHPAYLMNSDEDGLPVALQGRVPCKVQGPIDKGDLVVASDIPGVAQKLNDAMYMPGCVIGKALNSIEDNEVHSIEVVVGRV